MATMASMSHASKSKKSDNKSKHQLDIAISKVSKFDSLGKFKPSEYIKERFLSTAEKLAQVSAKIEIPQIVELIHDKDSSAKNYMVSVDTPLFQPVPSTIFLQSCEPFVTYEVVINFKNIDKVIQNGFKFLKND